MQTSLSEKPHSDVDLWYRNYWRRLQAREQVLASIRAPRTHWYWSEGLNEAEEIIFERTDHAARILDFGAGEARLKRKFLAAGYEGEYHTLDLSTEQEHTFYELSQVKGQYDAILCLEVIEHMALNEYVDLMDAFQGLLLPGGILVLSTPNPLCVAPMWALDAGHIQQYPLADLLADFEVRGYQVEAYRICLGRRPSGWPAIKLMIGRLLCYFLNVDYAQGLLLIGVKTARAE
jgi:predicted SAM-dependent methyltransferase